MRFGLTQSFDCSYLDDQQEQLLVYIEEHPDVKQQYEMLIRAGFRRSGEQIYRPHCANCQACQSIRIPTASFAPSRSQKRIRNKNASLRLQVQREMQPNHYELYQRYIEERHSDGSMYPPSRSQYDNFIHCSWNAPLFFEAWQDEELVVVTVVDELQDAYSALYTYFEPTLAHLSLGKFMILKLIEYANQQQKPYVYLGYQIDECAKMNYKRDFMPHERFFENKWHRITKNNQ